MSLTLMPFGEQHIAQTHAWLQDPVLRAAIGTLSAPTVYGNRRYWQARLADDSQRSFAIYASQRHVGNCGLVGMDAQRQKAELWIYLGEQRGRGLGEQALRALIDIAFARHHLHRLSLRVHANNAPARRLYERVGFAVEGVLRHEDIVDGAWVDSVLYALLRDENERPRT